MNKLFNGRTYNDDLLLISYKSLEDHIKKLDKVLSKFKSAGFKANAEKCFFAKNELEYLGFKIIRESIMPLLDNVKAI